MGANLAGRVVQSNRALFRSSQFLTIVLFLITFISPASLPAAEVTSTWTGETGNWAVNANWVNNPAIGGFPNNGDGGVATYDAIINSGNATLNQHINIQIFHLSGGGIDGSFNLTNNEVTVWTGGTMAGTGRTVANGFAAIRNFVFLDTRTLRIGASAGQTNGWIGTSNGAVITNVAGSTYDIQDDSSLYFFGGEMPVFQNAGTLLKSGAGNNSGGAGAGISQISMLLTNSGTVQVDTGTLQINGGGLSTGTMTAGPSGRIQFFGDYTVNGPVRAPGTVQVSGGNVDVSGIYTVANTIIDSGNLMFNSSIATSAVLNLSNGILSGASNLTVTGAITWTSGSMSGKGTTTANGAVAINGFVSLDMRTLQVLSSATQTGGYVGATSGAVITNAAGSTYDIVDDSSLLNFDGEQPAFQNAGTLLKSGSGNDASFQGVGISAVSFALTNSGTVSAQSGTLSFSGGFTQTGGNTILSGGVIASSTPLQIFGGDLIGNGTIVATVTNSGTISPGVSAGSLTITNGQLSLFGASTLKHELGGYTQGTQYDFIRVRGDTTFGGNLQVTFINNFFRTVTNGASFTLLTADTPIAGAFGNVASGEQLTSTDGYGRFVVTYAGSNNLLLSDLVIVDTDSDGIPDWWEDLFGLNKNDPNDAGQDADGDGESNLDEFKAGSNPTNNASVLRITAIAREGNDLRLTWTTVGGKIYILQTNSPPVSDNFTNNFSDIGPVIAVPGMGGESTTNRLHLGGATNNPALYYRVRVVP